MCKWGNSVLIKLAYPMHNSKRTEIGVDSCIASLMQELNNHGVHTLGCCCGHGKAEGSITIVQDGKKIELKLAPAKLV